MRALLDANVLIALFDEAHVFNERAHDWLEVNAAHGIATCPLTEDALVRILTNPNYSAELQVTPAQVIEILTQFVSAHDHAFWSDDISLRAPELFDPARILGSRQLTDLYLLALATRHKGRLVTFDERIAISPVRAAKPRNLLTI
ncbi:TA system VapC family ribonuclease toxin [Actomonas aquatica]|uniref:Ribonuclease VapC n=1 Tax=Actomonas aquatica TaxID=2866162 RepID=A0ABZ1C5S0_9BACT|nr:TA system VapC family ribonuclease toxin [Opitutus sp. WL0086]WRQ85869.1 TA system VapC family ribonuclease toxin [Opitutus sp. WL0086]